MRENVAMPNAAPVQSISSVQYGNPAQILGIEDSKVGVQQKANDIQSALNNPDDLIFGINKDPVAIKAHQDLKTVLSKAAIGNLTINDVRAAAASWVPWMTLGGATPNQQNRQIYNFLSAAAAKLNAGQPVFSFSAENAAVAQPVVTGGSQDNGWKKYIADDQRRAPIWDAWIASRNSARLTSPDDISFKNFVLWWKSNKADRQFVDNNVGGNAATIQRLKAETSTP